MSTPSEVCAAILADIESGFTEFPVVWPNETFDAASPPTSGHLGGFAADADHAIAQIAFLASSQESHGRTTGARSRDGELTFWSRCKRGLGPKAAADMAGLFEARYRANNSLLSGELDFGEPLSEEIGEVDGYYMWRTRCPFFQLTASP